MKTTTNHTTPDTTLYYVGLDVHMKFTAVCILGPQGTIVKEQKIRGDSQAVCRLLRETVPGPFNVVLEASDSYGVWYDRLAPIARSVQVAHPTKLKNIWNCKRKNDRVDARKLALMLMLDSVPAVHVPDPDVRQWRSTIQHRKKLVQKRTAIKNQLRALLRRAHIKAPRNLWSKKNLRWLAALAFPTAGEALQRDMALEDLDHVNAQIRRIEAELDAWAEAHPGVMLLKTIPGVGNRTAEAVIAWLDDIKRFGGAKQVGAYFGMVPSEDSSADRQRLGHITRQGPGVVRQLLVETVWRMMRCNPIVRGWVERFQHGQAKRKHIAVVATAHKLARCMFAMLRTGEVWNPTA